MNKKFWSWMLFINTVASLMAVGQAFDPSSANGVALAAGFMGLILNCYIMPKTC